MSGQRRTISCVLACRNQVRTLIALLPILSDTLTECGYPWEIIAIDGGSTDGTQRLLAAWAEQPGFRTLSVNPHAPDGNAFALGLIRARGDAVILIDAALYHSPALIPSMVLQWEAEARLIFAVGDGQTGKSRLVQWDDAEVRAKCAGRDVPFPREATELGLLDRRLLTQLMYGA